MTVLQRKSILCRVFNHTWEMTSPVTRRCSRCNEIEYAVLSKNYSPQSPKYVWSKEQDLAESDQNLR
jgi:hypothetical protein